MSITEQLRKAIENYGSTYAVSRDSGVNYSMLLRFISGKRDLRLETADRLCQFFGMHLTRPKRTKDKSPHRRR